MARFVLPTFAVVCIGVWIVSGFLDVTIGGLDRNRTQLLGVVRGAFVLTHGPSHGRVSMATGLTATTPGNDSIWSRASVTWVTSEPQYLIKPHVSVRAGRITMLVVPLWTLALASSVVAGAALWMTREPKRGHCRACGYSLAGLASGVCPECGKAIGDRGVKGR